MFKKKYLFIVIVFAGFISISILLVYSINRNHNKETEIELKEEIETLKYERYRLYEEIHEYDNKPMEEMSKEQIEFIKRYLNDFYEAPSSVNMNEFKFLLQTAFKKNIWIGEVRSVLSKLDSNYSESEYNPMNLFRVPSIYFMYTYKSEIWEMKLFFHGWKLDDYEIILLSKYPDIRKTIPTTSNRYNYYSPLNMGHINYLNFGGFPWEEE
jgi:hypothetical protein